MSGHGSSLVFSAPKGYPPDTPSDKRRPHKIYIGVRDHAALIRTRRVSGRLGPALACAVRLRAVAESGTAIYFVLDGAGAVSADGASSRKEIIKNESGSEHIIDIEGGSAIEQLTLQKNGTLHIDAGERLTVERIVCLRRRQCHVDR